MTYNHPFWDAPTKAEEAAAWTLVQKGLGANRKSPRELAYLAAELLGDSQTARARYTEFLDLWKNADKDRPELAVAQRYLSVRQSAPR